MTSDTIIHSEGYSTLADSRRCSFFRCYHSDSGDPLSSAVIIYRETSKMDPRNGSEGEKRDSFSNYLLLHGTSCHCEPWRLREEMSSISYQDAMTSIFSFFFVNKNSNIFITTEEDVWLVEYPRHWSIDFQSLSNRFDVSSRSSWSFLPSTTEVS